MQAPQPISQNTQLELQINTIRTNIWALEMGHDFLSRDDKDQIAQWNADITNLQSQMTEVV